MRSPRLSGGKGGKVPSTDLNNNNTRTRSSSRGRVASSSLPTRGSSRRSASVQAGSGKKGSAGSSSASSTRESSKKRAASKVAGSKHNNTIHDSPSETISQKKAPPSTPRENISRESWGTSQEIDDSVFDEPLWAPFEGEDVRVHVIFGLSNLPPPTKGTVRGDLKENADTVPLGNDGNQYYCQVCKGFGDVVCCDSCPRVYHRHCIPTEDPSRQALDSDADPWFCPICTKKLRERETKAGSGRGSRAIKRKCSDCKQPGGLIPLLPCSECGTYVHHPSCQADPEAEDFEALSKTTIPLCSNCKAEAAFDQEDNMEVEEESSVEDRKLPAKRTGNDSSDDGDDDDDESQADEDSKSRVKKGSAKKRKRSLSIGDTGKRPRSKSIDKKKKKKKLKLKKKKKKKRVEEPSPRKTDEEDSDAMVEDFFLPTQRSEARQVEAVPAFFFFITENRPKVEKSLARKHRIFNRLPKSMERNQLITMEAAKWWMKMGVGERRRYMAMSMRDFEARVIQWKEEKTIREMMMARDTDDELDDDALNMEADSGGVLSEDAAKLRETHERLYKATSVGSKILASDQGKSNNRILLELLQDIRFHPFPMFSAGRPTIDNRFKDFSNTIVPHFDVVGPLSTSVGDECLGCTRGWNHYCPVVKRRLPAVQYRAKLQPSMSSLLATRIGLGLRPLMQETVEEGTNDYEADRKAELFSVRETRDAMEAKKVPTIPSFSLSRPSQRVDDSVTFIEESLALKMPEPNMPQTGTHKRKRLGSYSRSPLPIRGKKKKDDAPDGLKPGEVRKCGRCRTIVQNDTGCVQCRRAQHVINISKLGEGTRTSPRAPLQVRSACLGRLITKDASTELSESDKAVAHALLKMPFQPSAVLPPKLTMVPRPREDDSEEESEEENELEKEGRNSVIAAATAIAALFESNPATKPVPTDVSQSKQTVPRIPKGNRRSSRLTNSTATQSAGAEAESRMSPDRQVLALKHRRESEELHQRALSIAAAGILVALTRRDPLRLFAEPVASTVEGYTSVVTKPIDFSVIRSRVLDGDYATLGAFASDVKLLCTNALAFNPPGSIYARTAKDILNVLEAAQRTATEWMQALKDALSASFVMNGISSIQDGTTEDDEHTTNAVDPFATLRKTWPDAVAMYEEGGYWKKLAASDFMRTRENENAYYGNIALRRASAAAETCLAPYPGEGGAYALVPRRTHEDDEKLRGLITTRVAQIIGPVQLQDEPTWREDAILKLLRKVQTRRVEGRMTSENGSARCDGIRLRQDDKMAIAAEKAKKYKRKATFSGERPRVDSSRASSSTGLGSLRLRESIERAREAESDTRDRKKRKLESNGHDSMANQPDDTTSQTEQRKAVLEQDQWDAVNDAAVTVRGSGIHGWGLFADQFFRKGDAVAEYVGEYITNAVADAREKMYQEKRIQDYQFRVDENLVVDATLKGGHGRYINHSCSPSCMAKIVPGRPPNTHLKRVMIIAQRDIQAGEEITYDYQFPLELDLDSRIPCNCGSTLCRGFMNWDLPEKGAQDQLLRREKRGGNMRDRIRRLGRPLKREAE